MKDTESPLDENLLPKVTLQLEVEDKPEIESQKTDLSFIKVEKRYIFFSLCN